MNRMLAYFVALPIALLVGCSPSEEVVQPESEPKLSVVATTPVLADFARNLGGEAVEVYEMLDAGIDPHDYEPTPADLQALANADVILRNGVGLEEWFDRTVESSGTDATIVDASEGVTIRRTEAGPDPHIWHSLVNAKIMVANIGRALQAADPDQATDYQASERGYDAQIDGLSRDIRTAISSLNDKRLVTNHDSLGYYADEFDLDVVATVVPSFDSQAEVSGAQVQSLIEQVRAAGVKAVFVEASVPSDVATAVAESSGAKIVSGEDAIYGDTLGGPDSPASTYLEMMRHNTDVIVSNLS